MTNPNPVTPKTDTPAPPWKQVPVEGYCYRCGSREDVRQAMNPEGQEKP